ncbi:MAG TPA: hypothetical protein PKK06_01780 [Phycisphaerae bacterium]|nr:hypothetical protein [Phycisphaerae bacterium]HNU44147.1 hypothetical protein [Phycisphaerae bacterium]
MADEELIELLTIATDALTHEGIEYAITGSFASGLWGEPHTSHHVDLLVRMTPEQAAALARKLPPRLYRSEEALVQAARVHAMADLIDAKTTLKLDLSAWGFGEYQDEVFRRRVPLRLGPDSPEFLLASPEDVILMKLVWRKDTGSRKQWADALGVVRVQRVRLDWKYLFQQARVLGVEADLTALRDEGGI